MIINKTDINSAVSSSFGGAKKAHLNNNLTDNKAENKTNNKVTLALGLLAVAGIAAIAIKSPKVKAHVDILKNKIGMGIPKTQAETSVKETVKTASNKAAYAVTVAAAMTALAKDEKRIAKINQETSDKNKAEVSVQPAVNKTIKKDPVDTGLSLEDFKNSQGTFSNGKAYLSSKPYNGKISLYKGNEQIIMNYENGVLSKTEINELKSDGTYEPKTIKTFKECNDGTKIIEVLKRKYPKNSSDNSVQWYTEKTYEMDDSRIDITEKDIFDQELGTYYKKQKNGTWSGFYEDRRFNFYTGPEIVPRDIRTNEILTKRQYKKFLRG